MRKLSMLVKISGPDGCSGGTCPAAYADDEPGWTAVQGLRGPRSLRRRMDGFRRRTEVASRVPDAVILTAADEIRARQARSG